MDENVGVNVNVNGVLIDELVADAVVRFPNPIDDDDDDKIVGLSNENGLNVLHRLRGGIVGSAGTTKRSFTRCLVGDCFFCDRFVRCNDVWHCPSCCG